MNCTKLNPFHHHTLLWSSVYLSTAFEAHYFIFSRLCVTVQVAVEDRLKLLQEAHRDFGPSSQHFLSSEYTANYLC